METVWRVILYGDFMLKLTWRLPDNLIHPVFENENPRQSPD